MSKVSKVSKVKQHKDDKDEKIRMPKKHKDEKQKNAQSYKIKSAADSLTETIILSAYFCHNYIIYHRAKENHTGRTKSTKNAVFLICVYYRL